MPRSWYTSALAMIVSAFIAAPLCAQTTYHLHDEPSSTTGLSQLKTAGPDVPRVVTRTANLKKQPPGAATIRTFDTQGGVPNRGGVIPGGSTVTFTIWMRKSSAAGSVFPRASLGLNFPITTSICEGTGTTALTTTLTAYTFSWGGNVARMMVLDQNFLSNNTYKQGIIHKLITIDSPHQGTVLARRLLTDPNTDCLHQLFAKNRLLIFDRVTLQTNVGVGVDGAIRDLVDLPLSPASAKITNLSPHRLHAATIAGIYTNFDRLDWHPYAIAVRNKPFGCPATPLAQALTSAGWPAVFSGEENDAIVPRTSQWNGLTGGIRVDNIVHSSGAQSLGFDGPSALATRAVSTLVIDLLNTPRNSPFYVLINP